MPNYPDRAVREGIKISQPGGVEFFHAIQQQYVNKASYYLSYLRSHGLDDVEAKEEFENGVGLSSKPAIEAAIDFFFRKLDDDTYRYGRYNRPEFPAFYGAVERATASIEKLYNLAKNATEIDHTIAIYSVTAKGEFLSINDVGDDIKSCLLRQDDWTYCQLISELVVVTDQGVIAPSVRHSGGTNIAVYDRSSMDAGGPAELFRVELDKAPPEAVAYEAVALAVYEIRQPL